MQTKFNRRFVRKAKPSNDDAHAMQQRYATAKNQWLAFHPNATAQEVEIATREMAERHGL